MGAFELGDFNTKSEEVAQRPSRVPWPPLLFAAAVFAAIGLQRAFPLAWPGIDDLAARIVGLSIGALGIGLIVWAAVTMARAKTTVLPHKGSSVLVSSGPFARFRNPIYLGDAMILLGLAELTKNIWFVMLVPLFIGLVTWLAILPEERHLEAKFGDAYKDYKAKTRRWV